MCILDCSCTAKHGAEAYCSEWFGQPRFCYLYDVPNTRNCPGAQQSSKSGYYTTDVNICKAADDGRGRFLNMSQKQVYETIVEYGMILIM